MGGLEPTHWIVILVAAAALFGGYKKLPEMARSAGRSMRIFKTELKGMADDDEARSAAKSDPVAVAQPVPAVAVAPIPPVAVQPSAQPVAAQPVTATSTTTAPAAPVAQPVTDPTAPPAV